MFCSLPFWSPSSGILLSIQAAPQTPIWKHWTLWVQTDNGLLEHTKMQFHGLSWFCHSQNSSLWTSFWYPRPHFSQGKPWAGDAASSFPPSTCCAKDSWEPQLSPAGSKLWYHPPKRRSGLRKKVQKPTHFWVPLWKAQCLLTARNEDFSVSNDSTDAFCRAFPRRRGVVSRRTTLRTIPDTCAPKYLINDKMKGFPEGSNTLSAK